MDDHQERARLLAEAGTGSVESQADHGRGMRSIAELLASASLVDLVPIPVPLPLVVAWNTAAGDQLSHQLVPSRYQRGVLTIMVENEHWQAAAADLAGALLDRLRLQRPDYPVRKLEIVCSPRGEKAASALPDDFSPGLADIEIGADETNNIQELTASLAPHTLRVAVRRFLTKQAKLDQMRRKSAE